MPEKIKKPRTEAQKAATAKLVASNKAKREAKKAAKSSEAAETPVEENVKLAIAAQPRTGPEALEKVAEESPESVDRSTDSESESESEPESERASSPVRDSAARPPQPADFSGEAHHVAKDVRERVEKPIRRSRSVSSFRYGKNKNLIDY